METTDAQMETELPSVTAKFVVKRDGTK